MNMVKEAYLDNSSTTRVYPEVSEEVRRLLEEEFGNPSSLHRKGTAAGRVLTYAQEELAELLGAQGKNMVFTSGGTESNNLAILGIARRNRRLGSHLVTTAVEHSSVLEPFLRLQKEGFHVSEVAPNSAGLVELEAVREAITPRTILVSIMHVNNETGAVMPVAELARAVKEKNPRTIFHVDAAQSFSKLPLAPAEQGIDALSISAHKFHGPKGVGALYLRDGLQLEPLFAGGGQQGALRPGTENTPGIAGMALAARLSMQCLYREPAGLKKYRQIMKDCLQREHPACRMLGPGPEDAAPHILSVSFPWIKGEILLHALEEHNIYISTGSACHARSTAPSHVLKAMGLDSKTMAGAVRISFSWMNSESEVLYAAEKISAVIHELNAFFR